MLSWGPSLLQNRKPDLPAPGGERARKTEVNLAIGVRVLLANPRWERRFLKFLEMSGVGRTMANGTDEDNAHAARMDDWEAEERPQGLITFSFFSCYSV